VHDQGSGENRFTTFDTSRAELRTLLTKEQLAVVIIEAYLLAGRAHDRCTKVGVPGRVASRASLLICKRWNPDLSSLVEKARRLRLPS
jgi:hypothetical protein